MSITIDPDSDVVTGSSGDNWYDHIQAWHDWIKGSSNTTKWDITDFTDDEAGSSGDKGFITTPTTGNLNFEMRIYAHSASSGVTVTASLDPGGNISSVASGTTKPGESEWPSTASQDPVGIFNRISDRHSGSLISATDESLTIMTRDPSGSSPSETPDVFHGGDIFNPVFPNHVDKGLDGLGYFAGSVPIGEMRYEGGASDSDEYLLSNDTNPGGGPARSLAQTSSGGFGKIGPAQNSTNLQNNGVSTGLTSPQPVVIQYANNHVTQKVAGVLKYSYVWDTKEHAMDKVEGSGTDAYIFVHETSNEQAHVLFPWDKTKDPKE